MILLILVEVVAMQWRKKGSRVRILGAVPVDDPVDIGFVYCA